MGTVGACSYLDDPPVDRPQGAVMASTYSSAGPTPEPFDGEVFQILALDGGGAKALFTAHVLARIEEDLGVTITDHFDLIAGTSAGGIVALGLGAGLRPAEIAEQYLQLVNQVFPRRRQFVLRPSRISNPAYSSSSLRTALESVLGDRVLAESSKRLLIPSWDLRSGEVHLFKTPHSPRLTRDGRIPMVDVALATSAAPTYFAAANVDGCQLVDGGVFANNPSVLAIAEAASMLGVPQDKIRVLNIGTMTPFVNHNDKLNTAGIARWGLKAVPLVLSAGSASTVGLAHHLIGFDNFVRLDANVPSKLFALDRIDPNKVASFASSVSRNLTPEVREKFTAHHAPAYEPANRAAVPPNPNQ
ncbi:patatin [Nocardioides marmoriginsengisoli]|uniref:Patatin n=1 Tax=Nocardioides marmoriginsengisoli TaxID=661483 RepID=A0A3N0CR64_9ACTN|nr:CBASS cGAMP-activated phospholipase [Nocardioides marmoriginsengisoli]RNL65403.1 patatin [Nocardioides marmoriginsengisoli]